MINQTVSHYKIIEKLGEGGMGVVYKATDTQLDRLVALKFLPSQFVASEEDRTRFIREAKAASSLDHPNICTVFEAGQTDDGQMFMAMAYYEGESLKDVIEKGPVPIAEAIEIALQVAEALKAANSKGIVHRDVKPGNILLTPDKVAKLVDFGLASQIGWATLTKSTSTLGTAAYMAPEQATGEGADHRSDLWSLGVVMYQMLTGKLPFRGDHEAAMMYSIVNEEPQDINERMPDLSPELGHVVMRLLEKDSDDRYQSADEVVGELRRLVHRSGAAVSGARTHVRAHGIKRLVRKWGVLVSSIIGMGTLGALAILFSSKGPETNLANYRYKPLWPGDTLVNAKWSPDGKSIAYIKMSHHEQEVHVRALESLNSTHLASINTDWTNFEGLAPIWSPDSYKIYYEGPSGFMSISTAGGDPVKSIPFDAYTIGIASDKTTILALAHGRLVNPSYTDSVGLYIVRQGGMPPTRYQNDPILESRLQESVPPLIKFSPDRSKIGLFYYASKGSTIWILPWPDDPDARPRQIFKDVQFIWPFYFEWLPDSRNIVLSHENALWVGDTEKETLRRITASSKDEVLTSISPDGKRLLVENLAVELDVIELPLDGSPFRTLVGTQVKEYSPSVSADGSMMAYVTERSGRPEIWIEEKDSRARPFVTPKDLGSSDSLFRINSAIISPDGKRVAYIWKHEEGLVTSQLWLSRVEGGSPLPLLSDSIRSVEYFCWAPDSKRIFARIASTNRVVSNVIISTGGGQIFHLPDSLYSHILPVWSPDGHWIAIEQKQTRSHGNRLLLFSPDGKQTRVMDAPGVVYEWYNSLVWSRDGKTLYEANSNKDGPRIYAIDVRAGTARIIAQYNSIVQFGPPRPYCSNATLSRNGKGILVTSLSVRLATNILEGAL